MSINNNNNIGNPTTTTTSTNSLHEINYTQFLRPLGIAAAFQYNSNGSRISQRLEPETAIRLFNSVTRPITVPTTIQEQNSTNFITISAPQNHNETFAYNNTNNGNNNLIEIGTIDINRNNVNNNYLENNVNSIMSIESEESNTCRICRQKRSDTVLINNVCKCSGTMGHIHLKCLYQWIRYRQKTTCEICHTEFLIPPERRNYYRLFKSFFHPQYIGVCLKHILNLVSITPLIYFTVNQMIYTIEAISEDGAIKVLVIGPIMLMATSLYLFLYFEWAMSCLYRIKNVIKHWWNFGDQNEEDLPAIDQQESHRGFFDFEF